MRKWVLQIQDVLETGKLTPGQASKLAGKLQWACQHMFHRVGRATLRPLYDQCRGGNGKIGPGLRAALEWWLAILSEGIVEVKPWRAPTGVPVHLFCDAAGAPQRIAAVLWMDGKVFWADGPPPAEILRLWDMRDDNQIMGLELLSIALGLSTFEHELANRKVIIHSDNTGAECGTRKGRARAFDHCSLVHRMWIHIARLHAAVWVVRVPTDDNIADLPSRHEYALLRALTAEERKPILHDMYFSEVAWAEFNRTSRGL